jgi:polyhydroxyalkanoate synthesis repressor PhaR
MAAAPIQIKRYPNRRYYARHTSQYVSLQEIEDLVQSGQNVEIRDSQSGKDLTRAVLTQIIMERQPEKMSLFPSDMLHFIVRSNDAMSDFLRDYFRHSLTYLDYLQRHSVAKPLTQPMHWVKAWLDGISPKPTEDTADAGTHQDEPPNDDGQLAQRIQELEQRLRQLESQEP